MLVISNYGIGMAIAVILLQMLAEPIRQIGVVVLKHKVSVSNCIGCQISTTSRKRRIIKDIAFNMMTASKYIGAQLPKHCNAHCRLAKPV